MLLKELILQTKNIDELYAFYKNVLQLDVMKSGAKTILISAGKTRLILQENKRYRKTFLSFCI